MTFDDARRDTVVQAAVTEFHCWRTGDWDAFRHALAAAFGAAAECAEGQAAEAMRLIQRRLKAP